VYLLGVSVGEILCAVCQFKEGFLKIRVTKVNECQSFSAYHLTRLPRSHQHLSQDTLIYAANVVTTPELGTYRQQMVSS
jgi:hypothetical protein